MIVYQAASLLHFLQEAIRSGKEPWESEIDNVHEALSTRIWRDNRDVLSYEQCLAQNDPEIKAFAATLDPTWQVVDLRNAKLGDGFSWGRYGARTANKRLGERLIFAYQKKSFGQRCLDVWR